MTSPTIQHHPRMLLAGFSFFGDPFHSHAGWTEANEIGRLWKRLMASLSVYPDTLYEVHLEHPDTPQTGEYEVFVGYPVDDIDAVPLAMCLKVLPASDYAQFTVRGDQIHEPIIEAWLRGADYRIAHPILIQRYDERFKGLDRMAESLLDMLVPVERR